LTALGQVVELHDVGQRLFRLLQDAPGVTLHCPARVEASAAAKSGQRDAGNGTLKASCWSPRTVRALRWAPVRHELAAAALWQVAVIANVSYRSCTRRAFERFTQHGPLAMLPMSHGRCSLVWCHPQSRRDEVLAGPTNVFV
jgi:2-octaprenyl-6-methoxyphenol hydroxylase